MFTLKHLINKDMEESKKPEVTVIKVKYAPHPHIRAYSNGVTIKPNPNRRISVIKTEQGFQLEVHTVVKDIMEKIKEGRHFAEAGTVNGKIGFAAMHLGEPMFRSIVIAYLMQQDPKEVLSILRTVLTGTTELQDFMHSQVLWNYINNDKSEETKP